MNDDRDASDRTSALNGADPPRNFTLSTEERIRALTIGVPSYAERKKHIEDREAGYQKKLGALFDTLAAKGRSREDIEHALFDLARTFDLAKTNALVEKHNRYYPIEANLPLDPQTGGYLLYGNPWVPEAPFTVQRVVRQLLAARYDTCKRS